MTPVLTPPMPMSLPAPAPAPVSPPAATPPPAVVVQPPPQPFRWTLEQYRELDKIGFFNDKRTMLIDGVIRVMPNPDPPHDIALGKTDDLLRIVFAAGHHVRAQMGFDIANDTDPAPDLAVVTGVRSDYLTAKPRTAALIIEVADSSLFFDTTTKAEKYATAGVQDYWVIDLEHRELIVFRDPVPLPAGLGATAYRQRNTYGPDATIAPLAAPGAQVKVGDLLP
jgi:Uma2 family endonuclease